MQNETLYNKTVDILVQAYFNDTLIHQNACGCAVGNIIAANMGYSYRKKHLGIWWADGRNPFWPYVTCMGMFTPAAYTGKSKIEIDSTGYSPMEIHLIESAFESVKIGAKDRMFKALMAVIDVLDEIHGNTDAAATSATKQKFQRQLQTA